MALPLSPNTASLSIQRGQLYSGKAGRGHLHFRPGSGKRCLCCRPWGRLWFVKTNYFSASAKRLGLHESESSVPMAATDSAMDKNGDVEEYRVGQLSPMAQDGNPLGSLSHPPSPPWIIRPAPGCRLSSPTTLQRWVWKLEKESRGPSYFHKDWVFTEAGLLLSCHKVSFSGDLRGESMCSLEHLFHVRVH